MSERILAVDDEPDMLKLLTMIIRDKTSYEIVTTNNPVEAVELAKNTPFDLVIADLKMPGLDGVNLIKAVREFDKDVPIIILTAYGTIESATEAMQSGAFDFLTKPFRKEQILFTIEKALKYLRVLRENKALKEELQKKSEG